jgi:hypothetical protein
MLIQTLKTSWLPGAVLAIAALIIAKVVERTGRGGPQ